eukprot:389456-Pleurochrysis_carterae.AAC.1
MVEGPAIHKPPNAAQPVPPRMRDQARASSYGEGPRQTRNDIPEPVQTRPVRARGSWVTPG